MTSSVEEIIMTSALSAEEPADSGFAPWQPPTMSAQLRRMLSFQNISALYLFVLLFVAFSLWVPSTFLSSGVWRALLSGQAVTCLVAVGLVPSLAAGVFDLAVGSEVGLGAILAAWALASAHANVPVAVATALLAGAVVGVCNWFLIVGLRIQSFIATLGVSSVLLAMISWVSDGQQIVNLPHSFASLGTGQFLGLQWPVYVLAGVALAIWYVLECTPTGRRVYATGADLDAARLAGVRTSRIILLCTVVCAVVAALAGLLESAQLATGDPTIGPGYALPAISAALFGSTQFRNGRMNVWGTVVASYVLATGVKGLQLAGLPLWIPDLFNGVALLVAVAMARYQNSPSSRLAGIGRLFARTRGSGVND